MTEDNSIEGSEQHSFTITDSKKLIGSIHHNISQDLIWVTEDKVRLCLYQHLEKIEGKNAWIAPGGILLTIILVFISSDFKNFSFISASTWEAFFGICALITLFFLLKYLYRSYKTNTSIDTIVSELKKEQRDKL